MCVNEEIRNNRTEMTPDEIRLRDQLFHERKDRVFEVLAKCNETKLSVKKCYKLAANYQDKIVLLAVDMESRLKSHKAMSEAEQDIKNIEQVLEENLEQYDREYDRLVMRLQIQRRRYSPKPKGDVVFLKRT
ncbi:hypothetical protein PRIPAC_75176 [Pristionchus pacificus]|uniref:Uncharacterized protein n=1 Tax=Pristionchus pacificus TaxID=54126 RepID=A0A2A6BRT2_PRIPA|nr:hypothetical protein PRIPAC_75176 [Pristionchus pacificus]|eukprot:PDM68577.1 hypothetical protein PRIPAC_44079 [Pristionchus pacificus]